MLPRQTELKDYYYSYDMIYWQSSKKVPMEELHHCDCTRLISRIGVTGKESTFKYFCRSELHILE
jgi:hypothetical protein